MRRRVAALLFGLSLFGAAESFPSQSRDEAQLIERVRRALAQDGLVTVTVRINDGVVVLSGAVESAREKLLAIEAAFSVAEVEAIDTELSLRVGVTYEVEEEIWFTLLQEGLDEGIDQVIVDNGVASISGQAPDQATRDRIHSLARRTPGVEAVTSAIQLAAPDPVPEPKPVPEPEPEAPPTVEPTPAPAPIREPEPAPIDVPVPDPKPDLVSEPQPVPVREPEPKPPPTVEPTPAPAPVPEAEPADVPVPDPAPVAEPDAQPEPQRVPEPEPAPAPEPEPTPAPSKDLPPPPNLPQDVAYQILTSPDYTVFDHVQFSIDGVDVLLEGAVTTATKKQNLETAIAAVAGVRAVQNDLRVLSDSNDNQRMRDRLFQRIYEDPAFAQWADEPNPPVHIIVEAKHVTLTGVVDALLLRMSAEAIVRTTFGVRSIRNEIRVRE